MGALFEIYESKLPEGLTPGKTDVDSQQRAPSDSAKSSGHIMLSYKWEHPSKPVMQEFKKQLQKRGYNVWMDEDRMSKFVCRHCSLIRKMTIFEHYLNCHVNACLVAVLHLKMQHNI